MLYQNSWPYFRNAILESGTPLIQNLPLVTKDAATVRSKAILNLAGCNSTTLSASDLFDCASNLDTSKLIDAFNYYFYVAMGMSKPFLILSLMPPTSLVLEGVVFTQQASEALANGNFKKCNLIIGVNKNEGGQFLALTGVFGRNKTDWAKSFVSKPQLKSYLQDLFTYYPSYPKGQPTGFSDSIYETFAKRALDANPGVEESQINYFSALSDLITEGVFACPAYEWAHYFSKSSDIFFYSYDHRISSTIYPEIYGVVHADDLPMLFGETLAKKRYPLLSDNFWSSLFTKYSASERRFNVQFIKYWTNFVRSNNPNSGNPYDYTAYVPAYWPKFVAGNNVFEFESPYISLKENAIKSASYGIKKMNCSQWKIN